MPEEEGRERKSRKGVRKIHHNLNEHCFKNGFKKEEGNEKKWKENERSFI